MCLDMDLVTLKLRLGEVEAAKGLLESAKEQLSSIKPSESVIFSKYYKAQTEYRKVVGPANEFYSAALMFLSYTNVEDLSTEERYILATDMALASVTGDDIYNFGEVLATPILSALKNSPNEWMLVLVEAMNSGNVDQFNHVVEAHRAQYFAQPALASKHESVVAQKIVLLSLVNIAFEKPSHERVIPFVDIAERSRIPLQQVRPIAYFLIAYSNEALHVAFCGRCVSLMIRCKTYYSKLFHMCNTLLLSIFRWSGC